MPAPVRVDGSNLEGGGQLVRSAVAWSAISGIPVTIDHIRHNREKPGLGAQHLAAVRAVASVCGAQMKGAEIGSHELSFSPGEPECKDVTIDVGTAGSVTLVIQAWLPVALQKGGTLTVTGGTEVRLSPTIDYFEQLVVKALGKSGAKISIATRLRGYYPRGGGIVSVGVESGQLRPVMLGERNTQGEGIISCSANLPDHVSSRQARSAQELLLEKTGRRFPVQTDIRTGKSTGSSLTAWSAWKGASSLGKRGVPAEVVGKEAANELLILLGQPGEADPHLADQLLIYLALYGGRYSGTECTLHAETMQWLLTLFGYRVTVSKGTPAVFSS